MDSLSTNNSNKKSTQSKIKVQFNEHNHSDVKSSPFITNKRVAINFERRYSKTTQLDRIKRHSEKRGYKTTIISVKNNPNPKPQKSVP